MKNAEYFTNIVLTLCESHYENELCEFKVNNTQPKLIGESISALSNSAALQGADSAYFIWGVDDSSHNIVGTRFDPQKEKCGNEELQSWLHKLLTPHLEFSFELLSIEQKNVVLLVIPAAKKHITRFEGRAFIRIGSYTKNLLKFPDTESRLWQILNQGTFEEEIAKEELNNEEILDLLDIPAYFELLKQGIPLSENAIFEKLNEKNIIKKSESGKYSITNLGAILLAKNLELFPTLRRKAIRVIQYIGNNKIQAKHEQMGSKGYAVGFEGLIRYVMTVIPFTEEYESGIRKTTYKYPELIIRELVINAMMHQDFFERGTGVFIEIFDNRLEITNPGKPKIDVERFIDSHPQSRNEKMARLLYYVKLCEERGSGIDKVIFETELKQLPAPLFESAENYTRVILFAKKELKNLTVDDKIRACYFHTCLKFLERDYMTNSSLRGRFGITANNSALISRIINETLKRKLIKIHDENVGNKGRKYLPFWAHKSF